MVAHLLQLWSDADKFRSAVGHDYYLEWKRDPGCREFLLSAYTHLHSFLLSLSLLLLLTVTPPLTHPIKCLANIPPPMLSCYRAQPGFRSKKIHRFFSIEELIFFFNIKYLFKTGLYTLWFLNLAESTSLCNFHLKKV